MAPSDHNRLYAGTGEGSIFYLVQNLPLVASNEDYHGVGVLRSSDGGDTWVHVGDAELKGAAFYRIAVHPTNPDVLFRRDQPWPCALTRWRHHLDPDHERPSGALASVVSCTDVVYDHSNAGTAPGGRFGEAAYTERTMPTTRRQRGPS